MINQNGQSAILFAAGCGLTANAAKAYLLDFSSSHSLDLSASIF